MSVTHTKVRRIEKSVRRSVRRSEKSRQPPEFLQLNGGQDKNLRVLVIAANTWPYPGQIALALDRVGFQVAFLCPTGSPVRQIAKSGPTYTYRSWAPQTSIRKAVKAWSPGLLICTDDLAVRALHRIRRREAKANDPDGRQLIDLIDRSLGDPQFYKITRAKSELIALAKMLDIACPETTVIDDHRTLKDATAAIRFPILLKSDGSWGGRGVQRVTAPHELPAVISQFLLPFHWPGPIRRLIGKLFPFFMLSWLRKWPRTMSIQELIVGHPCNRAVVCWRGRVLAGVSVEAVETSSAFGPATVVKVIDHPEFTRAAEMIVAKLKLSGFVGFDFILDRANKAWLIEMNPRATPICHLRLARGHLAAALFTQIAGTEPVDDPPLIKEGTVALFPGEMLRSNDSGYTSRCYHDLPPNQPAFVEACLGWGMKNDLRALLGRGTRLDRPKTLQNPVKN
jgi:ATP-grasp domain